MTYFISGGAKNGKSTFAQNLALSLDKNKKHYYIATMISTGQEDDERISRHILDRDGMGFETVECFFNIMDCLKYADKNGVFLVDSITALIQNSLFPINKNYDIDIEAARHCANELIRFAKTAANVIFVSDYIYSDAIRYSKSTEIYRKCLADIDQQLAKACNTVIEVSAGQVIIHKGEFCI